VSEDVIRRSYARHRVQFERLKTVAFKVTADAVIRLFLLTPQFVWLACLP